jgi:hypothetical protein
VEEDMRARNLSEQEIACKVSELATLDENERKDLDKYLLEQQIAAVKEAEELQRQRCEAGETPEEALNNLRKEHELHSADLQLRINEQKRAARQNLRERLEKRRQQTEKELEQNDSTPEERDQVLKDLATDERQRKSRVEAQLQSLEARVLQDEIEMRAILFDKTADVQLLARKLRQAHEAELRHLRQGIELEKTRVRAKLLERLEKRKAKTTKALQQAQSSDAEIVASLREIEEQHVKDEGYALELVDAEGSKVLEEAKAVASREQQALEDWTKQAESIKDRHVQEERALLQSLFEQSQLRKHRMIERLQKRREKKLNELSSAGIAEAQVTEALQRLSEVGTTYCRM